MGWAEAHPVCRFGRLMRAMRVRAIVMALMMAALPGWGQRTVMDAGSPVSDAPVRSRLILRDGTFQLVLGYKVVGSVVRYRSAERNGAEEEIPLAMVDLPATQAWARAHTAGAAGTDAQRPVLSPELAREEADRASRTPEVAKDLRLPEEIAVVALDTFRGVPELVPLAQQGSDLNRETAHSVVKLAINPASSAHRIADIPGIKADVQLHVPDPVFFVRVGTDKEEDAGGGAMVVDTHGAKGREVPAASSDESTYVLERVDVRSDLRQLDSFRLGELGSGHAQRDVVELKHDRLPGGHWLKLTPVEPLLFGEYALVEIVSDDAVNVAVWDFGVHPDAKENSEAQRPVKREAPSLQRR